MTTPSLPTPTSSDPNDNWYQRDFLVCRCSSNEHLVRLDWMQPTARHDPLEVYMSVHLPKQPLFQRLWIAVKYVFGYRCRYGDWDEVILGSHELHQLKQFIRRTEESYEAKVIEIANRPDKKATKHGSR